MQKIVGCIPFPPVYSAHYPFLRQSRKTITIIAKRKSSMEILLIPCMYFTKSESGRFGSFFRRYRYSAICLKTPISF